MENTEDLERLAELCLASAKTIKDYLNKSGHAQPTFDQNGPLSFPPMSPEAEYARLQLRHASKTLNELAAGPDNVGQYVFDSLHDINAFRYVWRYQIAHAISDDEIVPYRKVAEKTGTDERQMRKFVRQLIQLHVFCEPVPGHVAHTAASKTLTHRGVESFVAYNGWDNLPLVANQVAAIEKWGHNAQEANQTPGNLVYGNELSVYETYERDPELMSRFGNLMQWASGFEHYSNAHVVTGFDWKALGDGTVVDIGGNMGHCCIDIARANPKIHCVVQDFGAVVARAQDPAANVIPKDVKDRISFMAHNFYDVQPVSAEAYFLRMIMHDYSDSCCVKILQAIVPAMKPGSRIVIMDQVMPPVGKTHPVYERLARTMQLQMQLLSNGVEREYEEWEELLRTADPRLKIKNVNLPMGSLMSVIEVVLDEVIPETEASVDQTHESDRQDGADVVQPTTEAANGEVHHQVNGQTHSIVDDTAPDKVTEVRETAEVQIDGETHNKIDAGAQDKAKDTQAEGHGVKQLEATEAARAEVDEAEAQNDETHKEVSDEHAKDEIEGAKEPEGAVEGAGHRKVDSDNVDSVR